MKKTLSRIAVLMLVMTMVLTSAFAAFAETGGTPESAEGQNTELDAAGSESVSDPAVPEETANGTEQDTSGSQDEAAGTGGGDDPQPAAAYTVTWMSQDGTGEPLEVDTDVAEGTVPEYNGAAPAKAADSSYRYTFAGWAAEKNKESGTGAANLPAVTGDVTYYAAFSKEAVPHTHSYGAWTTTVSANYFQAGKKVRKCSCGATQTQAIPKLVAKNRWIARDGKLYYFDITGKLFTGWHRMKPCKSKTTRWCYFTQGGAYVTGINRDTKNKWVTVGGYKFYFAGNTKPLGAGFHIIKNKLYHMNKFGAVMYGKFKASDGKTYTTAKDGSIGGLAYYKYRYKTFILVDISEQTIWYYQNGTQKLKSDVVTGTKGKTPTPTGVFKVRSKLRNINLVGPSWNSHVKYWMAFKGSSYGLHDASWRSSKQFSNHRTYLKNGSHGCINLRPGFAPKLYNAVKKGTTVIVQK